jgi:hypothetical protein
MNIVYQKISLVSYSLIVMMAHFHKCPPTKPTTHVHIHFYTSPPISLLKKFEYVEEYGPSTLCDFSIEVVNTEHNIARIINDYLHNLFIRTLMYMAIHYVMNPTNAWCHFLKTNITIVTNLTFGHSVVVYLAYSYIPNSHICHLYL